MHVCLISCALLLSICSLWPVINLQRWRRYHVTTPSCSHVKSAQRELIREPRCSRSPKREGASRTLSCLCPPPQRLVFTSPGTEGPGRRPAGGTSLGRQQRHWKHSKMWYQRHEGPRGGVGGVGGPPEAVRYTVPLLLLLHHLQ